MSVRILGIIPARSGSKGLPDKNVKDLGGKPLLAWSVEQANSSDRLDKAIVSTDSERYASIARHHGADVPFLRPEEYARDESPTYDVVRHALDWFRERGEEYDIVAVLEPTSPLRTEDDIDDALETFLNRFNDADSLVSVGKVQPEHPYVVKRIENGWTEPYVEIDSDIHQRQQLPPAYFPYGVVYASKTASIEAHHTFHQDNTVPYVIERWQNYEIDDIIDFLCIERVLEYKRDEIAGTNPG